MKKVSKAIVSTFIISAITVTGCLSTMAVRSKDWLYSYNQDEQYGHITHEYNFYYLTVYWLDSQTFIPQRQVVKKIGKRGGYPDYYQKYLVTNPYVIR